MLLLFEMRRSLWNLGLGSRTVVFQQSQLDDGENGLLVDEQAVGMQKITDKDNWVFQKWFSLNLTNSVNTNRVLKWHGYQRQSISDNIHY